MLATTVVTSFAIYIRHSLTTTGNLPGSFATTWFAGAGELYYLRILLLHKTGATSFVNLRTIAVNGSPPVQHPTFKAAAVALGILEDDTEHHEALAQIAIWGSASLIRAFFVDLLSSSEIQDPLDLWEKHKLNMIDDFLLEARVVWFYGFDSVHNGYLCGLRFSYMTRSRQFLTS